jgi:DNA modification methylase
MSIFTGDAYKLIRKIPDERIHCVVTSPPYWGLRDYGVNGQMGLEASPEHYVRKMVLLFREIRRALKSDGSVWLNIGDSYWGSNKGAGQKDFSKSAKQARNPGSLANTPTTSRRHAFLKPKDLIGLPWRVALALQEDGWWLRQDNIWHKKNPMTESVLDRTTRSHEYIFHLTKSPDYYYNYIAVQEDCVSNERDIARMKAPPTKKSKYTGIDDHRLAGAGSKIKHQAVVGNGVKRNRRTVWTLPTSNFRGFLETSEGQVVPRDEVRDGNLYIASPNCSIYGGLFDLLAMALCDEHEVASLSRKLDIGGRLSSEPKDGFVPIDHLSVWSFGKQSLDSLLRKCQFSARLRNISGHKKVPFLSLALSNKPSSERLSYIGRILEKHGLSERCLNMLANNKWECDFFSDPKIRTLSSKVGSGISLSTTSGVFYKMREKKQYHDAVMPESLVEPCILAGCPKGGVVLDPFAGAGTTGVVAQRLGRKFIGFELNPEYADLARSRLKSDAHD